MSTHLGNQSLSSKKVESLLKKIQSHLAALIGFVSHVAQSTSLSGTAVPAGGNIVPPILGFSPGGGTRVRIQATASGSFVPGVVTPHLEFGNHGGALVDRFLWNQNADGDVELAADFVITLVPGSGPTYDITWTTTPADAAVTLGHGVSAVAISAALVVTALP
jgi:hypothetical protein